MRCAARMAPVLPALALALAGCASNAIPAPHDPVSSVIPSATGTPNSIVTYGNYEFVSVQDAGLIVTYATGAKAAASYAIPCADPSGMAATTINGANILAVVCFDTGSLITLTINPDGSLHALGSVSGLAMPYPGIALDGTNVYVPLFGSATVNGGVVRISIASPAAPAITGSVTLASPAPGEVENAGFLAVSGGYIYIAAGSESAPLFSSSTLQVIHESTMALVGTPFTTGHSPQQITISGTTLYYTTYDEQMFASVDISDPGNPRAMEEFLFANPNCHALPVAVANNTAYVGCFAEAEVLRFDVTNPALMQLLPGITGIGSPERMAIAGNLLLVTDASPGGALYTIHLSEL